MNTRNLSDSSTIKVLKAKSSSLLLATFVTAGMAWGFTGTAFAEESAYEESAYNANSTSFAPGIEHFVAHSDDWKELNVSHLDDIRGRFMPAPELEFNAPLSVILWDEGRGSQTGSGSGSHQSTQQGVNQQRQTLQTTTYR